MSGFAIGFDHEAFIIGHHAGFVVGGTGALGVLLNDQRRLV